MADFEENDNQYTHDLIMPELVLFNTVKSLLNFIRMDFHSVVDEKKTWLYKLFNGHHVENYNFFQQAKQVFTQSIDSPRVLDVRLFFDSERAHMPTIHINLPSENEGENGIGIDEGFTDALYDSDTNRFQRTYTRRYDATYNLIITSDNPFEVVMIYHFLKLIMVATMDHIQLSGLENPKTGGQDLHLNSDLIPAGVYMRGLTLSFSYDISVPSIFSDDIIRDFISIQTVYKHKTYE